MTLTELSSNWKKLQKTLASQKDKPKKDAQTDNDTGARPLKRKASTALAPVQSSKLHNKRPKTRPSAPTTDGKMGGYLSQPTPNSTSEPATKPHASDEASPKQTPTIGKYIAIDCEMVGTTDLTPFSTPAHNKHDPTSLSSTTTAAHLPEYSILARASIVSYTSEVIYDAYVLPPPGVRVSNYRTRHSGITPAHLSPNNPTTKPKTFATVQAEVAALMDGRILIGHALRNDMAVLGLSHPQRDVRDTSRHAKFRALAAAIGRDGKPGKGRTPSLKRLAREVLGWDIQAGEAAEASVVGHDSVEDARATMALFRKEKVAFEAEVIKRYGRSAATRWKGKQGRAAVLEVQENGHGLGGNNSAEGESSEDAASDLGADGDSGESDGDVEPAGPPKKKRNVKKKRKKKSNMRR